VAFKVLLVDDSRVVRSCVKVHLMGHGLDFVEASNGEAALQVLKRTAVDLIISDIEMPGMDGITLVKRVRAGATTISRAVPIILLTGQEGEEWRQQALRAGASDFVNKPVASANLLDVVRPYLPPVADDKSDP
jgi:two-component system chemotaxis response regulator CheY